MRKIKVGDVVFYRNWRLGDDLYLAKVANVRRKKGLVTLIPFSGRYGHGWTWGGKSLPMIITTSIDIFREESVWLAAGEETPEEQDALTEEMLVPDEAEDCSR